MKQASQEAGEWTMDQGGWTKVRGELSIIDLCDQLAFFDVLPNICMCHKQPVAWGAQDACRIAVGLTSIRVWTTTPIKTTKGVAAAGLDHDLAVSTGLKPRAEADVQGG
jgi:hypothetical protein